VVAVVLAAGALVVPAALASATGVMPTLTGAANFSNSGATLYGAVNPGGVSTTIVFCYSASAITITSGACTVASGTLSYASATQSPSTSATSVTASATLAGLNAATKYYYAIGASQSVGTTNWSSTKNFTTITSGPFVCTPDFYQVNNDYTWEFSPTTNSFVQINSTAQTSGLNGLGYDAENNYLYAMNSGGGSIFQIGTDGAENNIGTPATAPQNIGADFLPNTNFLLTASNSGSFALTDIVSPVLTTVALGESGATFGASDITWTENSSDTDYVGYGLKGTGTNAATLYVVTLPVADIPSSSANWSSIPATPLTVTSDATVTLSGGTSTGSDSYGAAYSDAAGDAFFYDNSQKELFEATSTQLAALGTQAFVFKASSASTTNFNTGANDGASCPNAASPFAAPTPVNDTYSIATNTTLSVASSSTSVFNNDQVVAGTSYNMDHVVLEPGANQVSQSFSSASSSGTLVGSNGTLHITNANLGYFTFTPNSGFTGTETFTYNVDETSPNNGVSPTSATVTINVVHQQVVSWVIGNDLSAAVASTMPLPASDLGNAPITYSVNTTDSNSADCSINATTGVITYFSAGVCTVDAFAAATSSYTAGTAEMTFFVTSLTIPTISWNPSPTSTPVSPSGTTITPIPTTNSPGAIDYTIASANNTAGCTLASLIAPIVLKSTTQGVCSITATVMPSGADAYETITAPFAILAAPTISWAPSPTTFTTAQSPQTIVGVTTNSDGAISYAIDPSNNTGGCTLSSPSAPVILHFTTTGGCTVDALVGVSTTYAATSTSQAFTFTTTPSYTITQNSPIANASTDTASQNFSDQLVTTGQSGVETFLLSGSPPTGVSISSTGVITSNGTTPAGVYALHGSDADNQTPADTGTWSYILTVSPAGGVVSQTNATGSVNVGTAFSDTIATTGNDGVVTFTTSSGTAFTVSSSGAVTAPNNLVPNVYTVSGTDTDAFGNTGTWTYALTVNNLPGAISTVHASGAVSSGTTFTDTLTTSGNTGPVTFVTTSSGNVFTVSSSGAVTAPNNLAPNVYTVSGTDADSSSDTGTWTYTLTVTSPSAPPRAPPSTPHQTIAEGPSTASSTSGSSFTGAIATTGNDGVVTFTTSSGTAFTVSSSGAVSVAGTLAPGAYTVSGTDTDANGDTGTWTFTLNVLAPAPTVTVAPPTPGAVGNTYTPVVTTTAPAVTITTTTPSICTVRDGVVTYVATGVCTLSFTVAPSASYASSAPVIENITVHLPANVRLTLLDFANNKSTLTSTMFNRLTTLARIVKRDDLTRLSINGYASSTGGAAHNQVLSLRRANVVTTTLLADLKVIGVTVNMFNSMGHGASTYVSSNTAAAANRRVSVYAW
jgi:outer membrane protein OmpA-like peptidoglycan-associated protein